RRLRRGPPRDLKPRLHRSTRVLPVNAGGTAFRMPSTPLPTPPAAHRFGAPWRLALLLWAALFVLLAPAQAAEQPFLALGDRIHSTRALLPASGVRKDARGELTIDDVRRLDARGGAFTPLHQLFGAGYVKDVYWLRLRVTLPPGAGERWLLQLAPPYLDDIRV